jgi:alpha-ketoglutarate-dependent taurine dioxygenase
MLKKMASALSSAPAADASIAWLPGFPVLIVASERSVSLIEWLAAHKDAVRQELLRAGSIRFRGFSVRDVDMFEACLQTLCGPLVDYTFRSTPRSVVSGRVYTSTEYPATETIPQHNEMSYTRSWPLIIAFFCVQRAPIGGETPVSDSRRVYHAIPESVRERFATRGVLYVRNYIPGVDLSWQDVFQTDDRNVVARFCEEADIDHGWHGDRLTTRQRCQGVARHPDTGEDVWFNQAHLFHLSSLPIATQRALLREFGAQGVPRHAYYGDGSEIHDEDLSAVREALDAVTIVSPWQDGDVLLLDNMLTAHGRTPFSGARRVVVAMADPSSARMMPQPFGVTP